MLRFLVHVISEPRKGLYVELGCILFLVNQLSSSSIGTKLKLLTWGSTWCLKRLLSLRFEYSWLAIPTMSLVHEIRVSEVHLHHRLLLLIGNVDLGVRTKRCGTDDESIDSCFLKRRRRFGGPYRREFDCMRLVECPELISSKLLPIVMMAQRRLLSCWLRRERGARYHMCAWNIWRRDLFTRQTWSLLEGDSCRCFLTRANYFELWMWHCCGLRVDFLFDQLLLFPFYDIQSFTRSKSSSKCFSKECRLCVVGIEHPGGRFDLEKLSLSLRKCQFLKIRLLCRRGRPIVNNWVCEGINLSLEIMIVDDSII